MADHELFDLRVDQASGDEEGVMTAEGEYLPLGPGESFVMVQNEGGGRDPMIRKPDGSEVPFSEWEPVCEKRVQETLTRLESLPELGHDLALVYAVAVKAAPELSKVDVVISDESEHPVLENTGGYAVHGSKTGTGRPEVVMHANKGLEHYEKLLETRTKSVEVCARKMGLQPEAVDAKTLMRFMALHELGHALDDLTRVRDENDHREKREAEIKSLPVPGYNPVALTRALEPGGKLFDWYKQNQPAIAAAGYSSRGQLIEAQEEAYHALDSEDFPDQFAVQVMHEVGVKQT